jgi:hypothetical protein
MCLFKGRQLKGIETRRQLACSLGSWALCSWTSWRRGKSGACVFVDLFYVSLSPQIVIDDTTLLILGGCGGPNAVSMQWHWVQPLHAGGVLGPLAH